MTQKDIKIELLYFSDCPSWKEAFGILEKSMKNLGLSQRVALKPVEMQEDAIENEFTGSPMIRINGNDLFPTGQTNYALGCRVYQTPEGYKGSPTEEMIFEKLQIILSGK